MAFRRRLFEVFRSGDRVEIELQQHALEEVTGD